MKKITKKLLVVGFLPIIAFVSLMAAVSSTAQNNQDSASGQGMARFMSENGSLATGAFTFDAKRLPNGKVNGKATLRNPSFKNGNGQNDKLQIDITCLRIDGNIAYLGGTTKRKNNLAAEAVFFTVQENGKGGEKHKLSQIFFWDDDPKTAGDAQTCQSAGPHDFPLEPIESGDVRVRASRAVIQN